MDLYIVEVEVDAAIFQQYEIPDRINPLDGKLVAVICAQKPGIVGLDQVSRRLLGP